MSDAHRTRDLHQSTAIQDRDSCWEESWQAVCGRSHLPWRGIVEILPRLHHRGARESPLSHPTRLQVLNLARIRREREARRRLVGTSLLRLWTTQGSQRLRLDVHGCLHSRALQWSHQSGALITCHQQQPQQPKLAPGSSNV